MPSSGNVNFNFDKLPDSPLFWGVLVPIGIFIAVITRSWPLSLLPIWIKSLISGGVMGVCLGLLFNYLFHKPLKKFLRQELCNRGIPIYLKCGYDLRGQSAPRCPECGKPFDENLLIMHNSQN